LIAVIDNSFAVYGHIVVNYRWKVSIYRCGKRQLDNGKWILSTTALKYPFTVAGFGYFVAVHGNIAAVNGYIVVNYR
jgi:hypothetical protein